MEGAQGRLPHFNPLVLTSQGVCHSVTCGSGIALSLLGAGGGVLTTSWEKNFLRPTQEDQWFFYFHGIPSLRFPSPTSLNPVLEVQLGIQWSSKLYRPVSVPCWNWIQFSTGLVAGLIVWGPQGRGPCG